MKIEIGESLASSYLNHVLGCRIIQTNWKSSGNWTIAEGEKSRARAFYQDIIDSGHFDQIFKESTFDQLLKQAEIDVLGINTSESTVYGIDVAFHGAGLNYGSKEETADRILKKVFRTLFVMQTYFDQYSQFQSIFITPKTNQATLVLIEDLIEKAKGLIHDESISIDFITNDDFFDCIVAPTIKASKSENDTSELFLRSVKLMQLDSRKNFSTTKDLGSKSLPSSSNGIILDKRTRLGMKIGQYVRHTFRTAYEQGLISKDEIRNLQDPTYSKETFNANFEVLRLYTRTISDDGGRVRYYAKEYYCDKYYLTSQWVEGQWGLYLNWLKSINYSDSVKNGT